MRNSRIVSVLLQPTSSLQGENVRLLLPAADDGGADMVVVVVAALVTVT